MTTLTGDVQIDACLEPLCRQGCRAVNRMIQVLEQGRTFDEVRHLSAPQRERLLQELRGIMAVYVKTGTCER